MLSPREAAEVNVDPARRYDVSDTARCLHCLLGRYGWQHYKEGVIRLQGWT